MNDLPQEALSTLEDALRLGGKLHAFRSGGGLRVIRVEKPRHGDLIAYGEHPHVQGALQLAAKDFEAGHRPYEELKEHWLTGFSTPDGELDAWLCRGATFDAQAEGDGFLVVLEGYQQLEEPKEVHERASKGETPTPLSPEITEVGSRLRFQP